MVVLARQLAAVTMALFVCGSVAAQPSILYMKLNTDTVVEEALAAQGLVATIVTSQSAFDTAIAAAAGWDLVVLSTSNASFVTTQLEAHIAAGGKALVSMWNLDSAPASFRSALGIGSATDFTVPLAITANDPGSAVWRFPHTLASVAAGSDLFADDGDRLSPAAGSFVLGSFPALPTGGPTSAVVAANGGDTITIGQIFAALEPVAGRQLVENCLRFLLQKRVLLHSDIGAYPQRATAALAAESLGYSFTSTSTDFGDAMLNNIEWDLVIVESAIAAVTTFALVDYIDNGGRAIVCYWDLDADAGLRAAFGVSAATTFSVPLQIFRWDSDHWAQRIWEVPNMLPLVLPVGADTVSDNGDRLTVTSALAIGGYTPPLTPAGQAAIILRKGGNAICISEDPLALDAAMLADLLQNCIRFLCEPPKNVLVLETSNGTASCDAIDAEYIPYVLTTLPNDFNFALEDGTDWDFVLVDNPCCIFDTGPLESYLDGCGGAIISYYALDSSPGLLDGLGITTAIDITTPMTIYQGLGGAIYWQSPNTVNTIPAGIDDWIDNGERLGNPSLNGTVGVYTPSYDPTGNPNQIAVRDSSARIVIAHDFDSLSQPQITDFVQNCVHHLLPPEQPNTSCATATQVGEGSFNGAIAGYNSCDDPSVWYSFTAPWTGPLKVSACGTYGQNNCDSFLRVYDGCGGTLLAWSDDQSGCAAYLDPQVTIQVTAGQIVSVQLIALGGGPGVCYYVLEFDMGIVLNDFYAWPIPMGLESIFGTLVAATSDGSSSCDAAPAIPDVWYEITPPIGPGVLVIDTCGSFALSGIDTILSAHGGNPPDQLSPFACNDNYSPGAVPPGPCAGASAFDSALVLALATAEPPDPILIRVTSAGLPTGEFRLSAAFFAGGTLFVRGDSNADGLRNIADVIHTLNELFSSGTPSSCADAADSNDDGILNIADAIFLLTVLFPGASPPPPIASGCIADTTTDGLGCAAPGGCP
ncbi:MAG: hypothetical protein ACKVX7_13700 [Planctomycetota bacterium]